MDEAKKAKLVAKLLKGSPYSIDNMEEFEHFFGTLCPDMSFEKAKEFFSLASEGLLTIKVVKKGKT